MRARVAQRMYNLYPAEPGRSRLEFSRFVAAAREKSPPVWSAPEPPKAPPEDDGRLPGTRYRLSGELGRGASSVVYAAEHVDLGRRVAIKVLDAEHTHSVEFAARFRREARSLSRLSHPGLVRVFDFGQAGDGRLFCAMELLEGRSLRQEIELETEFAWPRALGLVQQACRALEVAHRHGVIHRDIKPDNLFLETDGSVKLIDFGLARAADEGVEPARTESDLGAMTLFGTPEYMAPEQVAGARVDGRADLYALGCVLYELLTGRVPFAAESAVAILDKKLAGNPEPIEVRAPNRGFPRAVSRVVERALARHPSRRFASAAEMADAIADALAAPAARRRRRRALGGALLTATMSLAMLLVVDQARPWLDDLPAELPWLNTPAVPSATPAPVPAEPAAPPPGPAPAVSDPLAPAGGRVSDAR